MKKKTKYMIVGLVVLGAVVFGLVKGVPAYKKHVLTEHLETEITQSAGIAIDYYRGYIASDEPYNTQLLAGELHHLARVMQQLEDIQGEHEWGGSNEVRMAKEIVILYGTEAENKEYLLKGLEALEENMESYFMIPEFRMIS